MWSRLTSRIPAVTIDALLARANTLIASSQSDSSITFGKEFFDASGTEDNNLDLLQQLHQCLWPEIADFVALKVPVVDHASLLIKGTGAPGTALHQDRAYWVDRDPRPTIFSVWIALEDLSEANGGLMLCRDNEVSVSGMSSFNTETVLDHTYDANQAGGFPIVIPDDVAEEMKKSMAVVELAKGEAVAFDSFEPHTTGPNVITTPRLAMKIAYSDGQEKSRFLIRTDELETHAYAT